MNRLIIYSILLTTLICCKLSEVKTNSSFSEKNKSVNLYAFIGKKISVTKTDTNKVSERIKIDPTSGDTIRYKVISMDSEFICKYAIKENIYNTLKVDTIQFLAYDHYGRPAFEKYDTVLLYISEHHKTGKYYHQKYQFDPVQKTENDIWKGLNGESIEQLFYNKKNGVLKARKIFIE